MIVEFYGLSGSGKTTIMRQLVVSSEWTDVSFSGKIEISYYFILGCISHPILYTRAFLHYIARNKSLFYLWNFYFVRYAKYQKAKFLSRSTKYVILDEGPLQNILSYPDVTITEKELTKYLTLVPRVDKTVVFAIDEQRRKKQLHKRVYHQSWRKKHANDESWDDVMIQTDALFKQQVREDSRYCFVTEDTSHGDVISVLTR